MKRGMCCIVIALLCLLFVVTATSYAPKASAFTRCSAHCVFASPSTVSYLSGGGHCISFTLKGSKWDAGHDVKLIFDPNLSTQTLLSNETVSSLGTFSFFEAKLCGVAKGLHTIKARDTVNGLTGGTSINVV